MLFLALGGWIFRDHVRGAGVYIGDSDRLNSHLNVLTSWILAVRSGAPSGWDDVMFMGSSLYGLPYTFPNPLTYIVALNDPAALITAAGYVSIVLFALAGWAAYAFIYDVCRHRPAAFIGSALHQCSALAVLKVSQNDMSFAALIHIPLLMLAVRRIRATRSTRSCLLLLACVLTSLLYFTFLQKAAYVVLLLAAYASYRSWRLASPKPLWATAVAFVIAVIISGPRLVTVAEDFSQLTRFDDAVREPDFAELYSFQNIRPREFLRWFDDGIFGRFPGETRALRNNINLHEGLLLYTAQVTPFLIGLAMLRYRSRWWLFVRHRQDTSSDDTPFFLWVLLAVMAAVLLRPVAYLLFLMFLKVDFTHARVVAAGVLPVCTLVACWIVAAKPVLAALKPLRAASLLVIAALIGGALAWGVDGLGQRADGVALQMNAPLGNVLTGAARAMFFGVAPVPPAPRFLSAARVAPREIVLTWPDGPGEMAYHIEMGSNGRFEEIGVVGADTTQYRIGDVTFEGSYVFRVRGCGNNQCSGYAPAATVAASVIRPEPQTFGTAAREEPTWLHGGSVARVIWSGLTVVLFAVGLRCTRGLSSVRWVIVHAIGFMAVTQAVAYADFQINGQHIRSRVPFEHNNFLRAAPGEFRIPSDRATRALRQRLENDEYRSVLICDPVSFPAFCAPHISRFWRLRVPEGYSSGVPTRLASLPWPKEVTSLRAISFPSPESLAWPLLALLNVKYAVTVDHDLYRNGRPEHAADPAPFDGQLEVREAPLPVTPRAFFAASVLRVADAASAARTLFPSAINGSAPDVIAMSVVEGYSGGSRFSAAGTITARYDHDRVDVALSPADQARFLVLNELFHPRWHAYSPHGELTIYPTNAVMRGVVVPPGTDRLWFEFVPAYRAATALPTAGLGFGLLAFALRRPLWNAVPGGRPDAVEIET